MKYIIVIMKNIALAASLLAGLLACGTNVALAEQVPQENPEHATLVFEGVKEVINQEGLYILNRHTDSLWKREGINNIAENRARTQTCIRIIFKTDSRVIKPVFTRREGTLDRAVNNYYGVYRNGVFVKDYPGTDLVIESDGSVNEWMLVLPIMYGVNFKGIEIDEGAQFFEVTAREKRPIYIAIGDSITHGAGLKGCSSVLSYPYVLAEENGYNLYNTAIGGSQISPGLAYEYADIPADYVTVMWGYNDWNALKGDLTEIKARYKGLLENLLATQKKAKIYCILPTVAADENGGAGYASDLQGVRDAEREVVLSLNSSRLIIVDGKSMTDVSGLNGQVHFNNEGSVRFGKKLAAYVK